MVSFATKHDDPTGKLNWTERIGYGAGNYGVGLVNAIMGSFLTVYFTNVAFLDPAIVASIIAVSKIFDGVSDIIIGKLFDNTHHKMGRGHIWLLRMMIPFSIALMLLFFVPNNFPKMAKYVYIFLMYNIVNTVFYTSMMIPYYSMISLTSEQQYERGLLSNISQIFGTLANVTINTFFIRVLGFFGGGEENVYTQRSFTLAMLAICVIMIVTTIICCLFSKERIQDTSDGKDNSKTNHISTIVAVKSLLQNRYWLILVICMFIIWFVIIMYSVGGIYYVQYVFYDMNAYSWMSNAISVAQFAIMFITPLFMKKFGKTKVYVVGIGLCALGFLGFGLFGTSRLLMIIFNALKGVGLGCAGGMSLGMVADTITYGKLKTGVDAVGMGNAGISAAQKLGLGFGTAFFGWIIDAAGFDAVLDTQGIAQPVSVTRAIQFIYNWIPFTLMLVAFILVAFFYHAERDIAKMEKKS